MSLFVVSGVMLPLLNTSEPRRIGILHLSRVVHELSGLILTIICRIALEPMSIDETIIGFRYAFKADKRQELS